MPPRGSINTSASCMNAASHMHTYSQPVIDIHNVKPLLTDTACFYVEGRGWFLGFDRSDRALEYLEALINYISSAKLGMAQPEASF